MPSDHTQWERRLAIVDDLSDLLVENDDEDPEKLNTAVCEILTRHGATRADFVALDEKPGAAPMGGYRYSSQAEREAGAPSREWHWKLRRVRNRHGPLFECLVHNGPPHVW